MKCVTQKGAYNFTVELFTMLYIYIYLVLGELFIAIDDCY